MACYIKSSCPFGDLPQITRINTKKKGAFMDPTSKDNRANDYLYYEWTDLHVKERAAFDEMRELTGPAIRALSNPSPENAKTIEASLAAYDRWDAAKKAVEAFFVRFRAAAT